MTRRSFGVPKLRELTWVTRLPKPVPPSNCPIPTSEDLALRRWPKCYLTLDWANILVGIIPLVFFSAAYAHLALNMRSRCFLLYSFVFYNTITIRKRPQARNQILVCRRLVGLFKISNAFSRITPPYRPSIWTNGLTHAHPEIRQPSGARVGCTARPFMNIDVRCPSAAEAPNDP